MSLRIGFFQYELSHPGNAPHVGMCLLLADLLEAGHAVDAALVQAGAIEQLVTRIQEHGYDLVALDSVFTLPAITRIKAACRRTPLLIGGTNAAPLMLTSPADYAISGPGRVAMRAFVRALIDRTLPDGVPNLFFRLPDGRIDHTGLTRAWSLADELDPYQPALDWDYVGPARSPAANTRFASVVPEFGCGFQNDALTSPAYRHLPRTTSSPALDQTAMTERAAKALRPFLENTRGCAFCMFRFQTPVFQGRRETAARLAAQMATLQARYGIREFSVQSENPFRFLPDLASEIRHERIDVTDILLRTYPAILARHRDAVRRSLAPSIDAGIRVHLQQVGFENFVQSELDRLGKDLSVEENIRAARTLIEMKTRWGDAVELYAGHGLILFTPWTRPEDVAENIRLIRAQAPFLAGAISPRSRLCLYDPFSPIYRLAEEQGLTRRVMHDYGYDFRFADPRTMEMLRLARAVEGELARQGNPVGPQLSRAVLTAVVPLFTERPSLPADAAFRAAEAAARENLERDQTL